MSDPHRELPLDPEAGDVRRPPRPLRLELPVLAAVALGGLLGTPARYAVAQALPAPGEGWPLATFLVNIAGAFALGLLLEALARRGPDIGRRRLARLALGTGVLGSFTTYSSFAVELDLLGRDGHIGLAAGYAAASVTAGLLATLAGIRLGARKR